MNRKIHISIKNLLLILAIVALAAWLAGCSKEEQGGIVQQGPYEGQNAVDVLASDGLFVTTDNLKDVCRYIDKLGADGSIDDDDLVALGEKVGSDIDKPLTGRNAEKLGKVAGIGMATYCPEFIPMFQRGEHI